MLFQINEIIATSPFSLSKKEKSVLFNAALRSLTDHHYQHCSKYKSILDALKYNRDACYSYDQLPYLPVRLFKDYKLSSIDEELIFKSVKTHSRCLIVTEEPSENSFALALSGKIQEQCFNYLDAPVSVIGSENIPAIPLNSILEQHYLPNAKKVTKEITTLINF